MSAPASPACVHLVPDTHDAGAENQARYLIEALARDGVDPEIAYFGTGRAHDAFERIGVPMLHIPRRGRFRTDAIGRARRLRRAYRGREPRILHTWMLEANVIGMLAARSWPDTKVVITQRGSWNELDYPRMVRMEKLLLKRADHAISNSAGGAEMLASIGMDPGRVSVIPNGIPAERVAVNRGREEIRAELGWDGERVVVWIGRITDPETAGQKDLPTLLDAIALLRGRGAGVKLALIGPDYDQLRVADIELVADAEALGWHPRPAELMVAADVLALSSRREGHSNVVGEALLAGLPVVSTDCGEHCGLVRRCGGLVTPVGDPTGLADAIAAILGAPPERERVAARAAEVLSVDRLLAETAKVYSA